MARASITHPWSAPPAAAPAPAGGRGAPITYQPRAPAPGAAPGSSRRPGALAAPLPRVAAWLEVDERLRVDAAGDRAYQATHFEDLAAFLHALRTRPFDAALFSVAQLARAGRPAGEALAMVRQAAGELPTAALVSAAVDLATVLALGRAGVRAVIDVQRPEGWAALRSALAAAARPDVGHLAAFALGPVIAPLTGDVQRFVVALFDAPNRVVTVRDLARGLGVLPTTLMSRFFRADLPTPKRYLAYARLTRAAHLLRAPTWTVAAVADHLEYSSAQGFSRHLHLLLGVRPAEFRRQYDAERMLERFRGELLLPYLDVLREFWPLRAGPAPAPPAVARAAGRHPPAAPPPGG